MITLLSPAKSLDYSPTEHADYSLPRFPAESEILVKKMRNMSAKKIGQLMSISDTLSKLNKQRYVDYSEDTTRENAKQAILAFKGDVYLGLENESLSASDIDWAQNHVRILSGLYGVLRPKDLMQPYRLEMGTRLPVRRKKNLYEFWGDKITELLNQDLGEQGSKVYFNLASKEYFHSVKPKLLAGDLYSANFLEKRNGEYKFISFTAKKARGWLTRYIIDNRIDNPQDTKGFESEGFRFHAPLSSEREFIFVRDN